MDKRGKEIAGNVVGYAISRSPQQAVSGFSSLIDQNRLFTARRSSIDKFQDTPAA
jgi:hypothetical protein